MAEHTPFVPVAGQCFVNHADWVCKATSRLTRHPQYNNTEHGETKGWRGPHFTAMCFDQKGRRVRIGGDFQRAEDEGAFPVWWIWPDQIVDLLRAPDPSHADLVEALLGMLDMYGPPASVADACEYPSDHPITLSRAALTKAGER